jgi:hypothetical protein
LGTNKDYFGDNPNLLIPEMDIIRLQLDKRGGNVFGCGFIIILMEVIFSEATFCKHFAMKGDQS